MADRRDDEFYVGYLPEAPRGIAARVRLAIVIVLSVVVTLALLLVTGQSRFDPSVFEFGIVTEHTGVLREKPYPVLEVTRPGQTAGSARSSSYFLTVFGKRGAEERVRGLDGKRVRLRGSLIYRDDRTMLEVAEGAVEVVDDSPAVPPLEEDLGEHTLVGEIVDSKCFLGVMKPGNLKPHRACAARCISGGVPPVLLVRDEEGRASYYLLVSEEGEPVNRQILHLVAEPVEVTGRLIRRGDLLTLRADPASYRRID